MQIRDTGLGFGIVTLSLHWLSAILLLTIVAVGLTMARMAPSPDKTALVTVHGSLGLVVFALAAFRLFWRWRHYHPLPLGPVSPPAVIVGRSVAIGLLLAGVVMPVIGAILISARGENIAAFGFLALPPLVANNRIVAQVAWFLHQAGAYAFIMGLGLHVYGALKHHFVLKDDTLRRMLGKNVEL